MKYGRLVVFIRNDSAEIRGFKYGLTTHSGVWREVYQDEQRQIEQLGTAVKLALNIVVFTITFLIDNGIKIPLSPRLRAQAARYKIMNGLSDEKISPLVDHELSKAGSPKKTSRSAVS
jgi:hypothetical protein